MADAEKWRSYGAQLKRTASFSSVGLELALSVGLGYFVGDWLDAKLQTTPWVMIGGVVVGAAAGFFGLWRALKKMERGGT